MTLCRSSKRACQRVSESRATPSVIVQIVHQIPTAYSGLQTEKKSANSDHPRPTAETEYQRKVDRNTLDRQTACKGYPGKEGHPTQRGGKVDRPTQRVGKVD